MYFQWRSTPYGIIRISCEGLYNFADKAVRSKLRLYSITLSPNSGDKDDAELAIVLSDENIPDDTRNKIEAHYEKIFAPMGIIASSIWAVPEKGIAHILQNSWTWAGIASCAAIITSAGFEGFFWTAFWGAAGWFSVRALALITRFFRSA